MQNSHNGYAPWRHRTTLGEGSYPGTSHKSVNILVSKYTNKHITFNKGEYVGHLEPTLTDDTTIDQSETHSTNSITLTEDDG